MDGVATEIAQEVGMLLQHYCSDAGPGQQKPEHHPGRAAAGDAAGCGELRRQLSSPVYTFLLSLSSFTPDTSTIVSNNAAKSLRQMLDRRRAETLWVRTLFS